MAGRLNMRSNYISQNMQQLSLPKISIFSGIVYINKGGSKTKKGMMCTFCAATFKFRLIPSKLCNQLTRDLLQLSGNLTPPSGKINLPTGKNEG